MLLFNVCYVLKEFSPFWVSCSCIADDVPVNNMSIHNMLSF